MGSQEAPSTSNEQAHSTGSCLTVCAVRHVERDLNQGQLQVGLKARPSAQSANPVCAALARGQKKTKCLDLVICRKRRQGERAGLG